MRMVHVIPHAPFPGPEGHNSRHEALLSVMPGLTLAWPQSPGFPGQWDLALVESGAAVPNAARVVAIVKATNQPTAPIPADLTIPTGPYEGLPGSVGPLIRIAPEHDRDIDLLLVPSVGQNNRWFFGLPGIPGGWEMMSRASVVICAGGNGSLYEALWSGCRVVCLPQGHEQEVRAAKAVAAGESVVIAHVLADLPVALGQVESMTPLGRREPGATAFARLAL